MTPPPVFSPEGFSPDLLRLTASGGRERGCRKQPKTGGGVIPPLSDHSLCFKHSEPLPTHVGSDAPSAHGLKEVVG